MPLPASAISRLDDHFGQYTICVQCTHCTHAGELNPAVLARRYGWKKSFAWIVERLRCPACRHNGCRVEVAFAEKPRGWASHPS